MQVWLGVPAGNAGVAETVSQEYTGACGHNLQISGRDLQNLVAAGGPCGSRSEGTSETL